MLSTLFDQDLWLEQYGKKKEEAGIEKGKEEGKEEGKEKERARIIANLKAGGMSDAQITKFIFGNNCD